MKFPFIISNRQLKNPLLKVLGSTPKDFSDDTVADFSIGKKSAVLFLSIKYHRQNPDYIGNRVKQFKGSFPVRILLLLVDGDNPDIVIQKLTIFCISNNINIVLAFDYEEAGRWLLTLYDTQDNSYDSLKATNESNLDMAIDAINCLGPSKKEAGTLLNTYSTLAELILTSKEELEEAKCLSQNKIEMFTELCEKPF